MNYFKLKGQMIFAADDLGPAAMVLSNYFRTLAINIMFEKELELPEMAPETDIHLGLEHGKKIELKYNYSFKKSGSTIEIRDDVGTVMGVIDYDYLKHFYYFMATKKRKIKFKDLVSIVHKLGEMDK